VPWKQTQKTRKTPFSPSASDNRHFGIMGKTANFGCSHDLAMLKAKVTMTSDILQ